MPEPEKKKEPVYITKCYLCNIEFWAGENSILARQQAGFDLVEHFKYIHSR